MTAVICPVCTNPGGIVFGRYHTSCWELALSVDESLTKATFPEILELIAARVDVTAAHLRSLATTCDVIDLVRTYGEATTSIANLRGDMGTQMMNLHRQRLVIITRRAVYN